MFKISDISTAVGLIISGSLPDAADPEARLREVLSAIRYECDDWADSYELDESEDMEENLAEEIRNVIADTEH